MGDGNNYVHKTPRELAEMGLEALQQHASYLKGELKETDFMPKTMPLTFSEGEEGLRGEIMGVQKTLDMKLGIGEIARRIANGLRESGRTHPGSILYSGGTS